MQPRVRVLCLPDIDKAVGGVKQLYRHVEHLSALGWDAAIVTAAENFRPSWFQSSAATISFASAYSSGDFEVSSTILVLPETYLEANLSNFCGQDLSKFARVIFNQNAYYSFGGFSSTLEEQLATFYDSSNVLQVLSVSEDTHDFLTVNLNLADSKVSRIVNAVENIFRPASNPRIPSTGCPERIQKPRPSFSPSNVRVCLILMGGLALPLSL